MDKTSQMANAAMGGNFGLGTLIIIFIFATFYFIPAFVAISRRHFNAVPIFLTNLYLGWTVIGWLVALIWAFTHHMITESPVTPAPRPAPVKTPVTASAGGGAGKKMVKALLWVFAVLGGLFILSLLLVDTGDRQQTPVPASAVKAGRPVPADELFK